MQDAIRVYIRVDAGQKVIDLVDSIRFIPGTLVRKRLRKIIGLIFRKILLQKCR